MNIPTADESTTETTLTEATLQRDNNISATYGLLEADDSSADSDNQSNYTCQNCPHISFQSEDEFLKHLHKHVQVPNVTVQRLKDWYIKKLTSKKPKQKRVRFGGIAKKHTQSYFVPRPQGRLKLTLKLAADATTKHRSFEVVATGTQLVGPGGEVIAANGDVDNAVKEEIIDNEEPSAVGLIVEGSSITLVDQEVESTERGEDRLREPDGEESADKETEKLTSTVLDEEEEDVDESVPADVPEEESIDVKDNFQLDSPENGAKLLEEVCRETSDNLKRQGSLEEDSGSNSSGAPSPSPSEQLRPDFLAPIVSPALSEAPSEYQPSTMVELNGATLSEVPSTSPSFPSISPAPPLGNQQLTNQNDGLKQIEEPAPFHTANFQWGNSDVNENVSSSEERDPLQLPEPVTNPSIHVLSNDSLLRGFLGEEKNNPPVTVALNNDGHLSLGSEYISLDRLGDSPHRCEVCGERANSRDGLDEHRSKAGHYKCNRPECCGKVFPNSEELATHLQTTHATQYPRVMINQSLQSPPVQQLQQQVQRLPMPQGYLNQALSTNVPMVQLPGHNIHQMQPPGFPQRPPPVYRVPAPVNMAAPPHLTPQYANTQHMMSQMYNQQFHQQQQQQQQQQAFNQQQMPQQRPNYIQQMQQMQQQRPQQQRMSMPHQRGQLPPPQIRAKRMATAPPLGSSPNAKRHAPDNNHPSMKRPNVPPPNSDAAKRSLPDSMIHLTESITLSVRQPPPSIGSAVTVTPITKKTDAKAVANVLASRGITVTAAGGGNNGAARPAAQRQSPARPAPPAPVTTLNLNSAISIIPTGTNQAGGSGFAVPQNRSRQPQTTSVDRPPRPPTVDLTGDGPMHRPNQARRMRGRPPGTNNGRFTCQICDKAFSTEESLGQHMQLHRSPNKLPFKCNLCTAQYPTQQGLIQHRQVYHKEPASGPELAIPVVDLKQPGVLNRLIGLGIVNYIPLSQLSSPQGGHFGLPIVSVDGARDPAVSNLTAMGASNILSLGPIKQLPR